MRRLTLLIAPLLVAGCFNTDQPEKSKPVKQVEATAVVAGISRLSPGLSNKDKWAKTIIESLKQVGVPPTLDNACRVAALIRQESNFDPNPEVPGIGKLGITALKEKLNSVPFLGDKAYKYLASTGAVNMIKKARTEQDLDLAYQKMVNDLVSKFNLSGIGDYSLFASLIDGKNKITTLGAMQSKLDKELERQGAKSLKDIYRVRRFMYTIDGVLAGTYVLFDTNRNYSDFIYQAADYNAGKYTSRNVGFQHAVSKLSGVELTLDGDLLSYGLKGAITESQTEKALSVLSNQKDLGLNVVSRRLALSKEKEASFSETGLYTTIAERYKAKFKTQMPKEMLPVIKLESLKVSSGLTTARFAKAVKVKYDLCVKR